MNDFYIPSPAPQQPDNLHSSAADAPLLPMSAHRQYMNRIGLALAVLAVVFVGIGYACDYAARAFFPSVLTEWWFNWIVTDVSLYAVALPLMMLMLRPVPVAPFNETYRKKGVLYRKSPFHFGLFMIVAVIGLGFMYVGSYATTVFTQLLSAVTGREYMDALQAMTVNSPLWMLFVGSVIIAPIGEEFIFRKLLIDRTRRYGDIPAILLSAAAFALFHRNLFQLFYTFLLGAVLAYLYTRTGKYSLCVALHAMTNLYTGFISKVVNDLVKQYPGEDPAGFAASWIYGLYGMTAMALLVASIVLSVCLRRKIKLSGGTQGLTRKDTAALFCANAGVILFAVLCLVLTVYSLIRLSAIA